MMETTIVDKTEAQKKPVDNTDNVSSKQIPAFKTLLLPSNIITRLMNFKINDFSGNFTPN